MKVNPMTLVCLELMAPPSLCFLLLPFIVSHKAVPFANPLLLIYLIVNHIPPD